MLQVALDQESSKYHNPFFCDLRIYTTPCMMSIKVWVLHI